MSVSSHDTARERKQPASRGPQWFLHPFKNANSYRRQLIGPQRDIDMRAPVFLKFGKKKQRCVISEDKLVS